MDPFTKDGVGDGQRMDIDKRWKWWKERQGKGEEWEGEKKKHEGENTGALIGRDDRGRIQNGINHELFRIVIYPPAPNSLASLRVLLVQRPQQSFGPRRVEQPNMRRHGEDILLLAGSKASRVRLWEKEPDRQPRDALVTLLRLPPETQLSGFAFKRIGHPPRQEQVERRIAGLWYRWKLERLPSR